MRKAAILMACIALLALGNFAPANPPATRAPAATAAVESAKSEHATANPVDEELNRGTFAATILIFFCLFLVLGRTAWKPILMSLQNREQAIRDSIEAAKKAKEEGYDCSVRLAIRFPLPASRFSLLATRCSLLATRYSLLAIFYPDPPSDRLPPILHPYPISRLSKEGG